MTAVAPSDPDRLQPISPELEERLKVARLAWGSRYDSVNIAIWAASQALLHIRDEPDEWAAFAAAAKLTAREPQTQLIEYLAKSDGTKLSPTVQSDMGAAVAWWLDCEGRVDTAEEAAETTRTLHGYTRLAEAWRQYQAVQLINAAKTAGIRKAAASRRRTKEEVLREVDARIAARKAASQSSVAPVEPVAPVGEATQPQPSVPVNAPQPEERDWQAEAQRYHDGIVKRENEIVRLEGLLKLAAVEKRALEDRIAKSAASLDGYVKLTDQVLEPGPVPLDKKDPEVETICKALKVGRRCAGLLSPSRSWSDPAHELRIPNVRRQPSPHRSDAGEVLEQLVERWALIATPGTADAGILIYLGDRPSPPVRVFGCPCADQCGAELSNLPSSSLRS